MGFKTTALLTTASVLLASAPAFATSFHFNKNNPNGSDKAGDITSITTSFNDSNDVFTWSSTIKRNADGVLANGAWLVVNDGPNPKGIDSELAIYYFDEASETGSIYNYDGRNNSTSWNSPGELLDTFDLDVTKNGNDEVTYSFSYDATILNGLGLSPTWEGTAFSDKVGIWFHAVSGLDAEYDLSSNEITKFAYNKQQSWYDISNKHTKAVPEPASAAALGLFAVVGAFLKRKQSV